MYFIINNYIKRSSEENLTSNIYYIIFSQRISKTIVFLNFKKLIISYQNVIYSWLKHYSYNNKQTQETVQLYHVSLTLADKIRLYQEFEKSDSVIHIMLFSDVLAHECDIENINHAVQFNIIRNKLINMIIQHFDQDAWDKNQKKQAIFLIDNWCKRFLKSIDNHIN